MTLLEFVATHPILTLATLSGSGIVIYAAYQLFNDKKTGVSTLLSLTVLIMFYLFSQAYEGMLKESKTKTVVVMPNKQNLRLGEDGQLSFCIGGMARNWEKTENGIVSSSPRYYLGRPMKCLSVDEGIELLRKSGATEEQLRAMKNAYTEQ